MKQVIGKWQADCGSVFKLKDSGQMKRVDGSLVQELVNDVYFSVQIQNDRSGQPGAARAMKEKLLAESIAKALNEAGV